MTEESVWARRQLLIGGGIRMCLSIPAKVISIDGEFAEVDFQGVKKSVGINFVKDVEVGDYVLVHSGFAIEIVGEEDALETLRLWEEIQSAGNFR